MSERFSDQVALITGSTRGLGRATAFALAAEGATVVVNSRREDDCSAVAREIEAAGGQAVPMPADVADLAQARGLVQSAIAHLGRLDILVNNAGYFSGASPFWTLSEEQLRNTVNLNFSQVFIASQVAARQMIQQGIGSIINVSSGGALQAHLGLAAYDAMKGAVEALTRCMASELAPLGVRVNCIRPGALRTWPEEFEDSPRNRARLAVIPAGRFGTPQDFARLVVFLCSREAEYIVGETITLDGGRSCHLPVEAVELREQLLDAHGIELPEELDGAKSA